MSRILAIDHAGPVPGILLGVLLAAGPASVGFRAGAAEELRGTPPVAKAVLDATAAGENLLRADRWAPWKLGFERAEETFLCDNGADRSAQRGASQTVVLNQQRPEPIVAVAWSKAEGVTGSPDSDYALYLDLMMSDGTPLWGRQTTSRPAASARKREAGNGARHRPISL